MIETVRKIMSKTLTVTFHLVSLFLNIEQSIKLSKLETRNRAEILPHGDNTPLVKVNFLIS